MRCVVRKLSKLPQLEGLAPLLKVDYDYETFFMRLFRLPAEPREEQCFGITRRLGGLTQENWLR